MKLNGEWEISDIAIDPDMIVSDDGQEIGVYLETWFDVDAKFGTNTRGDEDTWINVYASYNPYSGSLSIEYVIDRPKEHEYFQYTPTKGEKDLIIQLIKEKVQEIYRQTPAEFCESAA